MRRAELIRSRYRSILQVDSEYRIKRRPPCNRLLASLRRTDGHVSCLMFAMLQYQKTTADVYV